MSGGVRGYVVAADGASSVANAQIAVVNGPIREHIDYVVTDGDGGFFLADLRAGHWELMATSPAGHDGRATVRVFDNAMSEVTIALAGETHLGFHEPVMPSSRDLISPAATTARGKRATATKRTSTQSKRASTRSASGTVEGRVLRAYDRMPLADVAITVVRGAGLAPDVSPLTDDAGWFALDGLPPGEWVLRAHGPGGEMGEATLHVTSGFVSVTIMVEAGDSWSSAEND